MYDASPNPTGWIELYSQPCRHPAMKVPTKVRTAKRIGISFLALPADGRSLACTRGHSIPSNSLKRPQRPELRSIRQDPIENRMGDAQPGFSCCLVFGFHARIVLRIGVFQFLCVRGRFEGAGLGICGTCVGIQRLGGIRMASVAWHQDRVLAFIEVLGALCGGAGRLGAVLLTVIAQEAMLAVLRLVIRASVASLIRVFAAGGLAIASLLAEVILALGIKI